MEKIYELHQRILNNEKTSFQRDFTNKIEWQEKCIAITGARGVGKSTLILQHIKKVHGLNPKALYLSADHLFVQPHSLYEIAEYHSNQGGTHLYIDEIHKIEDWSINIKSIYDTIPELHVVISGSSMLQINKKTNADLSRRMITYTLFGLSFGEFLEVTKSIKLKKYSLLEILSSHTEIAHEIVSKYSPIGDFKDYLKYGYYPYFLISKKTYFEKIQSTLNTVLENDIPIVSGIRISNIIKLKKLLSNIAESVPFQPNISKLAGSLEVSRPTLYQYLDYLERSNIINAISSESKSYSGLSKPDKLYLDNTNLMYSFNESYIDKGTLRETFFLNQLSQKHQVNSSKEGDFLVDNKYTFEIGGNMKDYSQIKNIKDSYIVADDLLIGVKNKIPLWLFGFLD